MARVLRPALLLLCAVASAGAGAGESLRVHSPVRSSCRPLRTVVLPGAVELGEAGRSWETLRLRGGSGNNNFQRYMDNVGLSDPNEFFRDFGDGPGNVDCSSTMFEIKPDSFNDTDSLMDGAGLWDFPGELRLVGEHIAPRVGHRVYPSTYLKDFWRKFNFTDYRDGWDHQVICSASGGLADNC
ncbi:hypothetical protein T484DRAFT_1805734 [Baffinella frigidus]|nr:hypothetical protein T484DRAFT_1805734 [Cryptophyta sp. CCMP2293]